MNFDDFMMLALKIIMIGLLILLFIVMPIGFYVCLKNDNRLLAECMKDHKEYECHAMLDSHHDSTTMPIPIIIPSVR